MPGDATESILQSNNVVDIISIISMEEDKIDELNQILNYPQCAAFKFPKDFYGRESKDDLIKYIKSRAQDGGTLLVLDSGIKENRSR
jgi:hypothetical protein